MYSFIFLVGLFFGVTRPANAEDYSVHLSAHGASLATLTFGTVELYGELAASLQNQTHDDQYVAARALGVANTLQITADEMRKIISAGQAGNSISSLKNFISLLESLQLQGEALSRYAMNKDSNQATAFRQLQKDNWEKVSSLLKLTDDLKEVLRPAGGDLGLKK